ncbi:uroporphyrinogen-III synthase [Virgibacillus ihumii]|uniref:uroporphyrinogen-III synthase n=1 Tax=Virgibacillus ihumii TaxID=2686091 RepID=UPI00157D5F5E|nr:uroporphyrinogen-III synthase [Virgibacillus ihumii]
MPTALHGKKIMITREKKQATEFSEKVLQAGGNPIEVPLLKISCIDNDTTRQFFDEAKPYNWIFFTSANGVDCFLKRDGWKTITEETQLAAVGHKTAEKLEDYGYQVDFIPSTYHAEAMTNEFPEPDRLHESQVLLIQGTKSRDVLPNWLADKDVPFDTVVVYESLFNYENRQKLSWVLAKESPDFITFTSPSTVDAFLEMNEGTIEQDCIYVCIGTTTCNYAQESGFENILTPDEFTIDGMIQCMSDYIAVKG